MSSEIQSQHQHHHDKQQRQRELLQQKTFPFILYNLLEYATGGPTRAGDNCDTISSSTLSSICWLPDGNSFIIRNKDVLMRDIMPRFFPQQTKYRSFLNIWGFLRTAPSSEIAAEAEVGVGWRHKDFVRGKPQLLQEIDRVANKSQSAAKKQHQSAKDKVNAVFAATAAAGGTSPAPYSRASRSSLGFQQFLSSHMVVNNNFCSVTRSCTDSTEPEPEQMELEMEGVNVNIANTEGSIATTDATRSRRSDDDAEVSQLQDNDSVDEVGEFNIMELDKIFDKDGDDKLSKALEDDLLSILSLDEDRHTNLFVCREEEDNFSSDFDMVYNTSTRLTALAFCDLTSPSGGGF